MGPPIWQGDGTPVEMWLLQLDLANHSRWTHELNSYPDAFRHRREFALRIEQALAELNFSRLAWAGDGGVFASDGRHAASSVIEAAEAIHQTFTAWCTGARKADRLGVHVSIHRALVTTADDPAYCFGTELNEFMKRERDLRVPGAESSTTVTSAAFRLLTYEQQEEWTVLNDSVGTLGRAYGRTSPPQEFGWLVGAWTAEPSGTSAYGALDDAGDPFVVYCFSGDDEHTGTYENISWDDGQIVGTFAWLRAPISGHFRLAPAVDKRTIAAAWWYAEDVPGASAPPIESPGAHPNVWTKVDGKRAPGWATRAIAARRRSHASGE